MNDEIYLDWNAATPPLPEVLGAMADAASRLWANPSSVHRAGRHARAALESTREQVASLLELHPRDVLFTSGGTEANNLALHSASTLVTSALEHPSVVEVARRIEARGGRVCWLPTPEHGRIRPDDVARALSALGDPEDALVAIAAANHETGVLHPIDELAPLVHRAGARLHVDAVQLLGKAPHGQLLNADSVALSGHKIRGPKGIGVLAFRGKAPRPLLLGGAQERGLRPGTQDAVLAQGLGVALRHAQTTPDRYARLAPLRDRLERALTEVAMVNGTSAHRLPHVSNVSFRDFPGPEMVAALDLVGIRVSSGSACSAGTSEPSKVIAAMLGPEVAARAVRFSFGEESTDAQGDKLIGAIFQILGRPNLQ